METRQKDLEDGQKDLIAGQKSLVAGQKGLVVGLNQLNDKVTTLETSVHEIHDIVTRIEVNQNEDVIALLKTFNNNIDAKTEALNKRLFRVESKMEASN